jgi:apolipoprotein N-acyltransferase
MIGRNESPAKPLVWALAWSAFAIVSFHLAYGLPTLSFLILGYLLGLVQLARLASWRGGFYAGLGVGLLTVGPQLNCFWLIFGASALVLWLVLAFWIGLFVVIARLCLRRFGSFGAILVPFVWTGLEYFRSELYYLKFSWLNIGYAVHGLPWPLLQWCGMYGVGFLSVAAVAAITVLRPKPAFLVGLGGLGVAAALWLAYPLLPKPVPGTAASPPRTLRVAGVQLEFPSQGEVVPALDRLLKTEPEADLLVLSEYTFLGPIPESVRNWCRKHRRYLIVGAEDPAPNSDFYDTALVIGPTGDIVFRQVKSVPIQFFQDGLPAVAQQLWDSPWGKLGLCICYDLSYTRVTDRLIRLGAQALIVPTMDVVDWGQRQHQLHARVAPVRAAEYRVPIFRLASSGVSQLIDSTGKILASAGVPSQGTIIAGQLTPVLRGTLPWDRWLAPFATALTTVLILGFAFRRPKPRSEPPASTAPSKTDEHAKAAAISGGTV